MTTLQLTVGALTLLTNAFFVGAEFALISVRRSQIEPRAEAGQRRAGKVLWGLEHVSELMATAQLGITLSQLVLGAVAEPAVAHLLEPGFVALGVPHGLVHPVSFVIALALATYLHMLVGEMVPKNIALAAPESTAMALGPALVALTRALRPVIAGINALANAVLRLIGVEPRDEVSSVFTDQELTEMVRGSSEAGLLRDDNSELVQDALELGSHTAGEVMLRPQDTVSADYRTTPEQLERLAAGHGFSRLPVFGPGGAVLGYLHIKDALDDGLPRDKPFPRSALRAMPRVDIATPLDEVLTTMCAAVAHLAVVTDGRGRLKGLVTMEDVLSELVGPVRESEATEPAAAPAAPTPRAMAEPLSGS